MKTLEQRKEVLEKEFIGLQQAKESMTKEIQKIDARQIELKGQYALVEELIKERDASVETPAETLSPEVLPE